MKNSIIVLASLLIIWSCNNIQEFNCEKYLSNAKAKDSVTIDILRFVIPTGEFSAGSRYSDSLRKDIRERLHFFSLIYYVPTSDGSYYFLISKKAPSIKNEVIGVGGHYKMKNKNIVEFVEVFHTPKMNEDDLRKKGQVLFQEMIKEGNINKYISNRNLVEFPDHQTYYDTETNAWKIKSN